ncbi:MAG: carboxylesterase/lipase family protein [Capsulimonadaceae bacterium]
MTYLTTVVLIAAVVLLTNAVLPGAAAVDVVAVESGQLQGVTNADQTVRIFKGVPFAAPPVGDLRWKEPQPAAHWDGIRQADKFGSAPLQTKVYGNINFRDNPPGEDCLTLNIWIPARPSKKKLPVIVWYYGGGFVAGSSSEERYDGENLAKKGVIVVEPNYRLGIFGFYAHPELTRESGHNSSGNYGFLDQVAALKWVGKNIGAFGGDPHNITIAGESAGSFSVSALMASPLSQGLFQKAIGESGAFFPNANTGPGIRLKPLADAEQAGLDFAKSVGANSLADMRAKSANDLLQAAAQAGPNPLFGPIIDGYFLPSDLRTIYAKGAQSHVPLLAGWNADEGKMIVIFNPDQPTVKSFMDMAQSRFGSRAAQFLALYPGGTDSDAVTSTQALAGDDFIAYSTWKWIDMQRETGKSPVYRYRFEQVPASKPGEMMGPVPVSALGATHAAEIEYVFQTLKSKGGVPWTDDDIMLSDVMSSYWVNFARTGNPNGEGLPDWPQYTKSGYQVMHLIGSSSHAGADTLRDRYEFLDAQEAGNQASHPPVH